MAKTAPETIWKTVLEKTKCKSTKKINKFSWDVQEHRFLARASFIAGLNRFGIQKQKSNRNIDQDAFDLWARHADYQRHASKGLEWHKPEYIITDCLSHLVGEHLLLNTLPRKIAPTLSCYFVKPGLYTKYAFRPGYPTGVASYDLFSIAALGFYGHLHIYAPRPFPHIQRYTYDIRNLSEMENVNPDLFWAILAKHEV